MPMTPMTSESASPPTPSPTASALPIAAAAPSVADVHARLVLSSLWASVMFVFAYVDIFGFFRADIIRGALASVLPTVNFSIDQRFLVLITLYIIPPALMVAGSTLLPGRVLRPLTMVLAALYAIGIVQAMIGDPWIYFQLGSAVEIALLLVIVVYAWRHRLDALAAAQRELA